MLAALRLLLKGEGYRTELSSSPALALAALEKRDFDLALIDLNYARDTTSGEEGLELLSRLQTVDSSLPVVVMTAWGSVEVAVEAMRRGACDFIQKPWDNTRLLTVLRTQVELGRAVRKGLRLEEENRMLRDDGNGGAGGRPTFIAESPQMRPVLQLIESGLPLGRQRPHHGENGTGKEVVAPRSTS